MTEHVEPLSWMKNLVEALSTLGDGNIAVRGEAISTSMAGTVALGRGDADPYTLVLSGCRCRVHIDWERLGSFDYGAEDVGRGKQPVVWIKDRSGHTLVRIDYPDVPLARVEEALAPLRMSLGEEQIRFGSMVRAAVVYPAGLPDLDTDDRKAMMDLLLDVGLVLEDLVPDREADDGYSAGSAPERARLLANALTREDLACLWAARGAQGATEIVEHLLAVLPSRLPRKTLIGCSDTSFLGLYLALRYPDLTFVHGNHVFDPALLQGRKQDVLSLLRLARGETVAPVDREVPGFFPAGATNRRIAGPIIPLNMSMAESLCCRRVELPADNILFLEEAGEPAHRILRMMDNLLGSGFLDRTRCIVAGAMVGCRDAANEPFTEMRFAGLAFRKTNLPVLVFSEFGHGHSRMPLVCNAPAEVEIGATKARLRLHFQRSP